MKIVIFGCGGHARSIMNTLLRNHINLDILFVDDDAKMGEKIMDFLVKRDYRLEKNDAYIIAVGDNQVRKKIYDDLQNAHLGKCISVVSDLACVGIAANIGNGTFVAPYAYVGPLADIGNNTIINTGSVVEHETVIGNHTHIAPHATICGRTRIGDNVFCGAGSIVVDKVSVCNNVTIGAGAVVVGDIVESGTYAGVPAKKIN